MLMYKCLILVECIEVRKSLQGNQAHFILVEAILSLNHMAFKKLVFGEISKCTVEFFKFC